MDQVQLLLNNQDIVNLFNDYLGNIHDAPLSVLIAIADNIDIFKLVITDENITKYIDRLHLFASLVNDQIMMYIKTLNIYITLPRSYLSTFGAKYSMLNDLYQIILKDQPQKMVIKCQDRDVEQVCKYLKICFNYDDIKLERVENNVELTINDKMYKDFGEVEKSFTVLISYLESHQQNLSSAISLPRYYCLLNQYYTLIDISTLLTDGSTIDKLANGIMELTVDQIVDNIRNDDKRNKKIIDWVKSNNPIKYELKGIYYNRCRKELELTCSNDILAKVICTICNTKESCVNNKKLKYYVMK